MNRRTEPATTTVQPKAPGPVSKKEAIAAAAARAELFDRVTLDAEAHHTCVLVGVMTMTS